MRIRRLLALVALLPLACATLADTGGGDLNEPNAAAGPFRDIRAAELGNFRSPPNVLEDDDDFPRDVSVLDADGDPATLEAFGYAAHTVFPEDAEPDPTAPSNEIVRLRAPDGRSFDRVGQPVLVPDAAWEGNHIGAPSALRVGDEIWLYYSAEGGIGLAKSSDGLTFTKEPEPVLSAADWAIGVPRSPFVMQLPDGRFQMLYEATMTGKHNAIGEAISTDGVVWAPQGSEPLIAPSGISSDPLRPHPDAVSAEAPCAVLATSSQGRTIQYVYYSALDDLGHRTIAMAARFGTEGPLTRAAGPVFGSSNTRGPDEPWVVRHPGFTLLFVTQRAGISEAEQYPAVAAGVAPATVTLPPP